MRSNDKKRYSKPQLRLIDPTDARWRDHLPRIRDLTRSALHELAGADAPDLEAQLKELLRMIDKEIAAAEKTPMKAE